MPAGRETVGLGEEIILVSTATRVDEWKALLELRVEVVTEGVATTAPLDGG
jgi:hypothetical protein